MGSMKVLRLKAMSDVAYLRTGDQVTVSIVNKIKNYGLYKMEGGSPRHINEKEVLSLITAYTLRDGETT